MQKLVTAFLLSSSFTAYGQSCPQLQGTFRCRAAAPFDLKIAQDIQGDSAIYTFSDRTGNRTFLTDGQFHDLDFQDGKGQYRAICHGDTLLVEARAPDGETLNDRYYIERAALVRVRVSGKNAASLSCAPTHGTWRLYRH